MLFAMFNAKIQEVKTWTRTDEILAQKNQKGNVLISRNKLIFNLMYDKKWIHKGRK